MGLPEEVAADEIRVNCVAPGTIWTDPHADPQRPAKIAALVPMGRAGQAEDRRSGRLASFRRRLLRDRHGDAADRWRDVTTDDSGRLGQGLRPSHRESVPAQGRNSAPVRLSSTMLSKGIEQRGSLLR